MDPAAEQKIVERHIALVTPERFQKRAPGQGREADAGAFIDPKTFGGKLVQAQGRGKDRKDCEDYAYPERRKDCVLRSPDQFMHRLSPRVLKRQRSRRHGFIDLGLPHGYPILDFVNLVRVPDHIAVVTDQ